MRIAFAHDYSMEHIGGTPTSLLEQKRALESAGHTVFVIQLGTKPVRPSYDNSNFIYIRPHIVMPEAQYKMAYIFASRRHDEQIKKILQENNIQVVHTQSEQTVAYAVVKVAKELGLPVVSTIHSFYWGEDVPRVMQPVAPLMTALLQKAMRMKFTDFRAEGKPVTREFRNWTLNMARQADAVISPSQHQANDMKAVWSAIPITVIPNPLRNLLNKPAKFVSKEPHMFRLVWAGRVDPEKRPLQFMRAVQIAQGLTDIPFVVDFVGSGTVFKQVKRTFPLPHVTYHGKQSHKAVVALIDKADALCMSSYHYDNQPMVIAEAISRYRPVIYCDEQLSEGVDIAGYLSENESPEAMAKAIVYLVEHPDKVTELSRKAQQASTIFEPDVFVKKILKLYRSVL